MGVGGRRGSGRGEGVREGEGFSTPPLCPPASALGTIRNREEVREEQEACATGESAAGERGERVRKGGGGRGRKGKETFMRKG